MDPAFDRRSLLRHLILVGIALASLSIASVAVEPVAGPSRRPTPGPAPSYSDHGMPTRTAA
jgi:hypothetical protein